MYILGHLLGFIFIFWFWDSLFYHSIKIWRRKIELTKEEEEDRCVVDEGEVCEEEIFVRSLDDNIWSNNPFNSRILKKVIN